MTSAVRAGLIGAGVGAASMFLLDPDRGGRRRALVRDKAVWASRKTRDAAETTRRDLSNRLTGLQARVRNQFADDTVAAVRGDSWSSAACAACTGLTIGAVALAAMRAWGSGHSSAAARELKSIPAKEGAAASEAGIVYAAPSEADYGPSTFFS